ncbi:MAG: hypothetical protein R3247_13850 [Rhodothermales bacterium]|nr:hypothetical protein [Rhodothermales bacterium]
MRSVPGIVLLLLAAACGGQPDAQAPPPAPSERAGAVLRFDTAGAAVFATNRETGTRVRLFEDERGPMDDEGVSHALLSSFGPYVSYRTEWYAESGARPSYGTTYTAVGVQDSVRVADLRTLFAEEDVVRALRAHPLVVQQGVRAGDLGGLLAALAEVLGCTAALDRWASSFAVAGVEADSAQVTVGLPHGCEAERGTFTTLRLVLPIRPAVRGHFEDLRVYAPTLIVKK